MKQIIVCLLMAVAFETAYSQEGNNICVWNAMNTYNTGGGPEELEGAIKCADEAAANEVTSLKSKTWLYRGQLFSLISVDKVLKSKYPTAPLEGIKAFKKILDLADPKFRDWEEVYKHLVSLGSNSFNSGIDAFQSKNYADAYTYFYAIKDANAIWKGKGKEPNIDLATALKNAALSAENAGNNEAALNVYKEWIAIAPEAPAYRNYALLLKKTGQKEEAKKLIDEAIAKYPKDANLLVEKINFFLDGEKYTEALGFVNNLLEVEPNNAGALFIKAIAYEKLNNEDSVVYYYTRAGEANPKNKDPWINLGALYVNKANTMVETMNKLGSGAEDVKKYNELKKQRRELYLKAKPYLEKAKTIAPDDAQVTRTLKQIEMYTAE